MIITVPMVVDSTVLASSTVPEPDASQGEVAWNAAASYSMGNVVIRTTTHRKYTRLDGGSGVDAGLPENTPLLWKDSGPTNRYAMFQHDRNTATVAGSPLVVELALPNRVNTIALLGLQAGSARVEMIVSGETVYDQTFGLSRRNTRTWSDYFFGGFKQVKNMLRTDLPLYSNATLRVTFNNGATPVKCAGMVVNKSVYIGQVEAGAVSDARNFSEFERDRFGGATLQRQRSVPNGAYTIYAEKALAEEIEELRDEELNGVVALYSGLDDRSQDGYFGLALKFGIYTQFSIAMNHPTHAVITLKVEEF